MTSGIGRRRVIATAGGAFLLGFHLDGFASPQARDEHDAVFSPNAFVCIGSDDTITFTIKHLEMGQGIRTALAMLLAEELDADWSRLRLENAAADPTAYANLNVRMQVTAGSTSVANAYLQMRQAGAIARAMLVAAASDLWRVPATKISVARGRITEHVRGRSLSFGALVPLATRREVPDAVVLKDPKEFNIIGRSLSSVDTAAKCTGTATFMADFRLPGLLTAVVAHPPRFGGVVLSFDATGARNLPGVRAIFSIPSGVAIVAESYWSADRARRAIRIAWDDSAAEHRGTDALIAEYRALADRPGISVKARGNVDSALAQSPHVVTADYTVPFLAHAAMEPLGAVIRRGDSECELWYGCQFQSMDQTNVARVLGLRPDQIKINTLFAGGSFGRRANFASDFVVEAAEIAKRLPAGTALRLMWSREDDIRGGRYRPMYHHRLKAGLDHDGRITAWTHRIVGQSIMTGTPLEAALLKRGFDPTSVEGAANLPYDVPNISVESQTTRTGIPVGWLRSVGNNHTIFAVEAFFDLAVRRGNQDPLIARRRALADKPRHLAVLNLLAKKSGWGMERGKGRAQGIAIVEAFGSVAAQVVEVSLGKNGRLSVDSVVCAVDCGLVVNPAGVQAQIESGIAFGLSAALTGEITLRDGIVEQSNFDTYDVLRMDAMPAVEVFTVPSDRPPSGIGEIGVPPIAPAVANAILALTGRPVTRLPLSRCTDA